MMTCLLVSALCVTWNAFTGVSLLEVVKKYEGTSAKEVHAAEVKRNVAPSKEVINALEQANDWSKYRSIEMTATGYTSGIESTGKRPGHPEYGITYSGVKAKRIYIPQSQQTYAYSQLEQFYSYQAMGMV